MRNFVTSSADLAGASAVTVGAALFSAPLGWVVGGMFVLALSRQAARR